MNLPVDEPKNSVSTELSPRDSKMLKRLSPAWTEAKPLMNWREARGQGLILQFLPDGTMTPKLLVSVVTPNRAKLIGGRAHTLLRCPSLSLRGRSSLIV